LREGEITLLILIVDDYWDIILFRAVDIRLYDIIPDLILGINNEGIDNANECRAIKFEFHL